ncbi:MAG TPA: hypothetical protein PKH23_02940 [Bacillota bacterium]|nr:hypothetical protein [Bacillota bacterium]
MNEAVKAAINLHALLRNMEDLCQLDEASANAIRGHEAAIRFSVPGIDRLVLTFHDGQCSARRGENIPCDMNLRFSSPEHLNLMVAGEKNPLPTKGFRHIGFLKKTFTFLAGQLESYLKPDRERIKKEQGFLEKSTILTAYTAFFAVPEISRYDETGQRIAGKMEEGIVNVTVGDDFGLHLIAEKGSLRAAKGRNANARAAMMFDSFETAFGLLNGDLDSYTCIGKGNIAMRGRIPMIDSLDKLLGMVPRFLS